jgi:hypothetical protein
VSFTALFYGAILLPTFDKPCFPDMKNLILEHNTVEESTAFKYTVEESTAFKYYVICGGI